MCELSISKRHVFVSTAHKHFFAEFAELYRSLNSLDLGTDYVKVVEDRPIQSVTEMLSKESSF